jgi:hypothetical protein
LCSYLFVPWRHKLSSFDYGNSQEQHIFHRDQGRAGRRLLAFATGHQSLGMASSITLNNK